MRVCVLPFSVDFVDYYLHLHLVRVCARVCVREKLTKRWFSRDLFSFSLIPDTMLKKVKVLECGP